MTEQPQHELRCENCSHWLDANCMVIEKWLSDQEYRIIEKVGCASFNLIGSQIRSRPAPSPEPMLGSTDLLLLANDEWKRRQERKHLHDNAAWVSGFVGGFLTDKKWARDYVDKLRSAKGGRSTMQIKFWQFRFAGETNTREIPYGELEAFLEKLPLPGQWPFTKGLDDIRDLKLKTAGEP